jgi:tape measure domain-containing protein
MYQLIQALGSGTLAGDELRSVREGAPLAYKAIEKFVQGVYKTDESLKDLASQGKITSDMVVASIMNAGDKMDKAFAQTTQTFAQTWSQIKNAATKAFEPVVRTITKKLNELLDTGLVEKFEVVFNNLAKVVMILGKSAIIAAGWVETAIGWMVDNWYWLQHVVLVVVLVIIGLLIKMTYQAIASAIATAAAWLVANWVLLLIVAAIVLIIWYLYYLGYSATEIIAIVCGSFMFLWNLLQTIFVWLVTIIYYAIAIIWDALVGVAVAIINTVIAIGTIVILVVQGIVQAVLWILTTVMAVFVTI